MFEVELKAVIKNKEEVLSLLGKLDPSKRENVIYHDTYFDSIDKGLTNKERELRVRKISNSDTKIVLTYKGEPFDKISKSKPEYEVIVDNHDNILNILKFLGFQIDIEFSKDCLNLSFEFNDYNILATLVKIPELDLEFIEIETIVNDKNQIASAMENLYSLIEYLKIDKIDLTSKYYTELVREARNRI